MSITGEFVNGITVSAPDRSIWHTPQSTVATCAIRSRQVLSSSKLVQDRLLVPFGMAATASSVTPSGTLQASQAYFSHS